MDSPILIYGGGSLCRLVESMIADSGNEDIYLYESKIDSYQHKHNGNFSNKT